MRDERDENDKKRQWERGKDEVQENAEKRDSREHQRCVRAFIIES